jgi:hypothetical protein
MIPAAYAQQFANGHILGEEFSEPMFTGTGLSNWTQQPIEIEICSNGEKSMYV